MKIHLGVLDVPYNTGVSTGDVATWLEDKYGVMKVFVENNRKDIEAAAAKEIKRRLDDLFRKKQVSQTSMITFPAIEKSFRKFLDDNRYQAITGKRIEAAIKGHTSRKKKKTTGKPRPAFEDTLLYRNSFKAWIN